MLLLSHDLEPLPTHTQDHLDNFVRFCHLEKLGKYNSTAFYVYLATESYWIQRRRQLRPALAAPLQAYLIFVEHPNEYTSAGITVSSYTSLGMNVDPNTDRGAVNGSGGGRESGYHEHLAFSISGQAFAEIYAFDTSGVNEIATAARSYFQSVIGGAASKRLIDRHEALEIFQSRRTVGANSPAWAATGQNKIWLNLDLIRHGRVIDQSGQSSGYTAAIAIAREVGHAVFGHISERYVIRNYENPYRAELPNTPARHPNYH